MAAVLVLGLPACSSGGSDVAADTPAIDGTHQADDFDRPGFLELGEIEVTVDGQRTTVAESPLRYQRRDVETFDDPATPGHDGVSARARAVLECATDEFSIGGQTFTVDAVSVGVYRGDADLVERGLVGVDWGVGLEVDGSGTHLLERECGDSPVADSGRTHHSAQWLEALGRTILLVESSPFADDHRDALARYRTRMQEIADLLVDEDNARDWEEELLVDDEGNMFTHKAYMVAAGLGMTALLSDEPDPRWARRAEELARRAIGNQRDDGVNPERGGHDVSYQMYGTWLAQLYHGTLAPGDLKDDLGEAIDRAIAWYDTRVDPVTGQVDITGSTRVCNARDGAEPLETADAVRVHLTWSLVRDRPELAETAVRIDAGARSPGNPCPPG